MKKFLLVFALLLVMPAWALCSVTEGESVCTLPQNNPGMPVFQDNSNVGELNMDSSNTSLNPTNMDSSFSRTQNKTGIQMQGSLGCQFGNCNSEINNQFLQKK